MIVIHVLVSLLALLGPLAVFSVALGGLQPALSVFDRGHFGAELAALSYIAAMVTLAIAGSFFLKKRRVPGSVLYAIAVVPYLAALGYAVVRHRVNVGLLTAHAIDTGSADYFLSNTTVTESALAIGASMSAFAMLVVACAALSHRLSHHSSANLVVASFASTLLLASVSAHELGRARAIHALPSYNDAAAHSSALVRAGLATEAALVVGVMALAIALATFFVDRARRSSALLVMVVATCAGSVAPTIMFARDGRFFRAPDPTQAVAGVRVPETRLTWRERTSNAKTIYMRSDGKCTLGPTDALPEDLSGSRETFGLVADRDVTYRMLTQLATVSDLELYVTFAPEQRAAAGTLGTVGKYLTNVTVARLGFHGPSDRDLSIVLDGAGAHVMRAPDVDLWLPLAPEASAMRREAFKHIKGLFDDNLYIAPRPDDSLSAIWQIANDVRETSVWNPNIILTSDRRTPAERAAATAARFSGNVW